MSDVLSTLVSVTTSSSRSTDKCQAQSVVVWLIRGILAIRKNSRTETIVFICKIDPLMGSNLELTFFLIRTLHGSDVPVVSCHFVMCGKWERGFENRFFRLPIHCVEELNAVSSIAGGQSNSLYKL